MKVSRYNAKDCTILINGVYLTGLAEDMVTWAKKEPLFEPEVGAQGDVVKNEINDTLHEMTVTLQTTSPQVPMLLALKRNKEEFPAWCINKSLGLKMGGAMASIEEMPEINLGKTAGNIAVKLCVFDGDTITE